MNSVDKMKKEVYVANAVIVAIDNVKTPMIMYEEEKQVVRKALKMYIDEIEDKMCGNYVKVKFEFMRLEVRQDANKY